MSAPDSESPQIPPQTPLEGVPVLYMNWLRTIGSAGDLAIDVGYQTANMPPQPAVHLVMSWEHAKLLRNTLTDVIDGIEKQIGEIRDLRQFMRVGPPQSRVELAQDQEG
jgi:hypothetical protein